MEEAVEVTPRMLAGRIEALRAEYEKVRTHVSDLERERRLAEHQALRIGGAIRALSELLGDGDATSVAENTSRPPAR